MAQRKSERTRERVLRAAARVFREKGYAQTTLAEVAEAAGMQAGSLYYHFDSKEAMAEAIFSIGVETAQAKAQAAVDALPPNAGAKVRLFAALGAHIEHILAEDDYASATLRTQHQAPERVRKRTLRKQRAYGAWLDGMFRAAADAGELRTDIQLSALRMLVLGAMNWSIEWYDAAGALKPAELREQLLRILEGGIVASNSSGPMP